MSVRNGCAGGRRLKRGAVLRKWQKDAARKAGIVIDTMELKPSPPRCSYLGGLVFSFCTVVLYALLRLPSTHFLGTLFTGLCRWKRFIQIRGMVILII
jgi:hypothetical protein